MREAAGSTLPGIAPSNAYRSHDGYVPIAGNGDSIFKRLMEAIDRDDLGRAADLSSNAGRVLRVAEIDAVIERWAQTRSIAEVLATLGPAHVPCRPGLHRQRHSRRPSPPRARIDPAPAHP